MDKSLCDTEICSNTKCLEKNWRENFGGKKSKDVEKNLEQKSQSLGKIFGGKSSAWGAEKSIRYTLT